MSRLTPQQIQLLETRPHRTQLWLSIYKPNTVLACQVNDATITRKARDITYDSVSEGSHLSIESGMVMYVGTEAGKADKGTIRAKSATASAIEVAENAHIDWADTDHLTVVNFYEITAIYPRIIQNPSNELDVIFYKDYDLAYTNQNSVLGSFPCMGPHRAAVLDTASNQTELYYTASGTSHVKDENLSYAWWFQGATVTGSYECEPGYVTYDTPGHYTTRLYISGSSSEDYSYRHVSIYERPEDGVDNPFLKWEILDFSGSRDDGGYRATIRVRDIVNVDTIRDGSLVVLFSEDWYGNTKQSIGGNAKYADEIVFNGYILDGSIEYNYEDGYIEFDIGSPTEVMKGIEGFAISVESKVSPSTWFELLNMNCKRGIYHYLRWHTTAMLCTDFEFVGDDQNIQFFDSDRESMYDAIQVFMENTLVGNVVADRQGKIWMEIEIKAVDDAETSLTESEFSLTKDRWMNTPLFTERQHNKISYLEMGGIQYDGPGAGTFQALLAMAPGDAPAYGGSANRKQGLALASQAQLNTLVGNVFEWENSRYPDVQIMLSGNYRNFDIAPQEIVKLTVDSDDTPRQIVFSDKAFTIRRTYWSYLHEQQFIIMVVELAEVTDGILGETLIIPDTPPSTGYNIPPFELPQFPGGMFGNIQPFILYDEGIQLGQINSLDIIGSDAYATASGTAGEIHFSCAGVSGSSTGIYARSIGVDTLNVPTTNTDMYITAVKQGLTSIGNTLRFDIGGTYSINFIAESKYESLELAPPAEVIYCIYTLTIAGDSVAIQDQGGGASIPHGATVRAWASYRTIVDVEAGDTISIQVRKTLNYYVVTASTEPLSIYRI